MAPSDGSLVFRLSMTILHNDMPKMQQRSMEPEI